LPAVNKDPRDQEPGENKKKINAHPAIGEYLLQVKGGVSSSLIVQNHEEDGHAANTIECGKSCIHKP